MLRRLSKESPPPTIDELEEVTLRRPVPVTPPVQSGPYCIGPYFSRPMGPEFMRRSCTFVAEAGWRKSSGGKDAKERQNLALKGRVKPTDVDEDVYGATKATGRVQRLVGNVAGNLKSWSSSEDVRQSVMGAFNRTVSVITQGRRSSKIARNSIPELTAVTHISSTTTTTVSSRIMGKSVSASKFSGVSSSTPAKNGNNPKRYSAPPVQPTPLSHLSRNHQDRINNNSKTRLLNNNKNASSGVKISSKTAKNNADDHLFKKPAAPVGYKHYRASNQRAEQSPVQCNGSGPDNVPRASAFNAKTGQPAQRWFRHFQETQASVNDSSKEGGRGNRRAQQPSSSQPQEHDSDAHPQQDRDGGEDSLDDSEAADSGEGLTTPGTSANNNNNATDSSQDSFAKKTDANDVSASNSTASGAGASAGRAGGGSARRLQEVQIIQIVEDTPLISPSEVTVSQGVVLSAQPVLTPIEHLRRKDLKIKQALKEKQHIIADILDIPREHFGTLGDMASEPGSGPKEPRELVLAAIYQANCLQETLNEALTIRESDIVAAKAGGAESANKLGSSLLPLYPAPMNKLMGIAGSLSHQLNALLNLVSERDDERDRMRKELVASRERMHQLHLNQSPGGASISSHSSATPTNSRPNSIVSQTSTPALDIRDDSETVSADERVRTSSTQEDLTDLIAREAQEEGEVLAEGIPSRQPGTEVSVHTDDDVCPESSREEGSDLEQPQHHLPTT